MGDFAPDLPGRFPRRDRKTILLNNDFLICIFGSPHPVFAFAFQAPPQTLGLGVAFAVWIPRTSANN
jgi:hypothetical protein